MEDNQEAFNDITEILPKSNCSSKSQREASVQNWS